MINVPVPEDLMQADDGIFLLLRETAPLQVGAQVVDPPQPAALAAPLQTWMIQHQRRTVRTDHTFTKLKSRQKSRKELKVKFVCACVPASLGTELQHPTP